MDFLQYPTEIACSHQNKCGSSGEPEDLAGEAIPSLARLLTAARALVATDADLPPRETKR